MTASPPPHLLIRGARIYDGTGGPSFIADVRVAGGVITEIGPDLAAPDLAAPDDMGATIIEAQGRWLMPGLLDIHTHFDLEAEIAPALPEAVRHGTTTVVVANCSLGLAYGHQRRDGQDPVVDCFARVENIPKPILKAVADKAIWQTSADYLAHLEQLPLGPNMVPLLPHSMLRIEVMGLHNSISRDPDDAEIAKMEALLQKAMAEGYAGFSTDALPFHYLANRPHERSRIPAQYGRFAELRRLTDIVRAHQRVWQATPPKDRPLEVLRTFFLSSGRFYGKPLKLTAVAAIDVASNKGLVVLARLMARLLNSRFVRGSFRMQALAAPFRVWAEGPLTPLAEEIPSLRRLNEPDLDDRAARRAILADPHWQAEFRAMWRAGKSGVSFARLKRILRREDYAISRNLADMEIDYAPVAEWAGRDMGSLYRHWRAVGAGEDQARSEAEAEAFTALDDLASGARDEAAFLIALLAHCDTDLCWSIVSANRDPKVVRDLVMDPLFLPGFNDSGAHLTNMAFYDGNLRALKIAQAENAVAYTVARLTREPADFFGIDAGRLEKARAPIWC
ncbi:hypothetical protein JCM17846_00700 [Iodidimonas nitroreducens]|uniref:N-acyl-D-glutamate deacylase n=1 Tax=Iodidimonas nitroreducens TaxID=1236968 RepID=A0A5A7N2N8_9PROT|nr:hypothetical protein [Iodidimonas nitroreducens]GER02388.1 hypothetical protein JCM17846_00700 [Iodidimonas nitroreducens]